VTTAHGRRSIAPSGHDLREQYDDRVHMLACHPLRDVHQEGLGIAGEYPRAHGTGRRVREWDTVAP
jgi:hypothetical protein